MNRIRMGEFVRISKRAAERLYNKGETVRICACKMSPLNVWGDYSDMQKDSYTFVSFETVVNDFRYYNCNSETGYYPAFYVKEGSK